MRKLQKFTGQKGFVNYRINQKWEINIHLNIMIGIFLIHNLFHSMNEKDRNKQMPEIHSYSSNFLIYIIHPDFNSINRNNLSYSLDDNREKDNSIFEQKISQCQFVSCIESS